MKILISTGNGRIHFVQAAPYLKKEGLDVTVLTGWLPRKTNGLLVRITTLLTGHKNLAAGMEKRLARGHNLKMIGCALPEFFTQFLFLVSRKTKIFNKDFAATLGWKFFGWNSKHFLKGYNIFHVRSCAGGGGAIEKAKKLGIKVIADHSIAHPSFFDEVLVPEFEKYNEKSFITAKNKFWQLALHDCNLADIVLVNSDFVKNTFVKYGFNGNKIKVIYWGVREDFFQLKTNYETTSTFKLLFTGGFEVRKGAEYILKALQYLDEINFDYELTVVGTNSAQTLIKKYPVKHINLVGHVPQDDLKKYLSDADVYLFPSLGEGCASSGMEAMAAGLPVIATLESGLPLRNKENGIIVESKNVLEINNAVIELSKNKELRERIGRNAAIDIQTKYTWDIYAKNVSDTYNLLIN